MEWNQEIQYKRSFGPGSFFANLSAENELIEGLNKNLQFYFTTRSLVHESVHIIGGSLDLASNRG